MFKKKPLKSFGGCDSLSREDKRVSQSLRVITEKKRRYREMWLALDMKETQLRNHMRDVYEKRGIDYDEYCAKRSSGMRFAQQNKGCKKHTKLYTPIVASEVKLS